MNSRVWVRPPAERGGEGRGNRGGAESAARGHGEPWPSARGPGGRARGVHPSVSGRLSGPALGRPRGGGRAGDGRGERHGGTNDSRLPPRAQRRFGAGAAGLRPLWPDSLRRQPRPFGAPLPPPEVISPFPSPPAGHRGFLPIPRTSGRVSRCSSFSGVRRGPADLARRIRCGPLLPDCATPRPGAPAQRARRLVVPLPFTAECWAHQNAGTTGPDGGTRSETRTFPETAMGSMSSFKLQPDFVPATGRHAARAVAEGEEEPPGRQD